ncbi:MAG: amidohydrolase [Victivallales bacterium]|nr:amidohydrolase [Victivallales bacterium]
MRKIFDVHTHVWPDKIAAAVLVHLQKKSCDLPVYTDGTYGGLKAKAEEAGYTAWMNLPVVTHPGQAHSLNEKVAAKNHWPTLSMGGVHPDDEDVIGELHHVQDLGLFGLKMHPEYQEFNPLEERMEKIWSFCEEQRMPVLIHAGNDVGFQPPYHSRPADFAEVVRRHPALTLICAHMGGWLNWGEMERDLAGRPVYIDTSFSAMYMKDEPGKFERLIRLHGVDRVVFGTDSPWQALTSGIADIEGLTLSEEDKEKIFWGNADRLFGLSKLMAEASR